MNKPFATLRWLLLSFVLASCGRSYRVGDHVICEWEENEYPAMIIEIPGPGLVKVHYDGYDELWDEVVRRNRLKGHLEGQMAVVPPPPNKVRRTAVEAAKSNHFKIGDRIKVEWHRHYYNAVVVGIVGPERYHIHFEGYGSEWDENVSRMRMQPR